MQPFSFLYNRTGEILTFLVALAIGAYLYQSFSGSRLISRCEAEAFTRFEAIFNRMQGDLESPGRIDSMRLAELKGGDAVLAPLRTIDIKGEKAMRLYSDGAYYYLIRFTYPPQSAEDYLQGSMVRKATGFKMLAWPLAFSVTGEVAYYADDRGKPAVSSNKFAAYDGLKTFPPDLKTPFDAIESNESVEQDKKKLLWIVYASWRDAGISGTASGINGIR